MGAGEWLPRGWTCAHVKNASSGPCNACRPGDGLCQHCKRPIDDHVKVGEPTMSCKVPA